MNNNQLKAMMLSDLTNRIEFKFSTLKIYLIKHYQFVMDKILESDLQANGFKLQSCYYVHFRTDTLGKVLNPLIPLAMCEIISLQFYYNDGFSIKLPTKIHMPLKKPNQTKPLLIRFIGSSPSRCKLIVS